MESKKSFQTFNSMGLLKKYSDDQSHWYGTVLSKIENVGDLKKIFGTFSLPQWIFRGQRCFLWKLEPSLRRHCGYIDWNSLEEFLIDDYKEIIQEEFKRKDISYLDQLALIQHYGGKTRLLDFTKDPYIALFFAFYLDQEKDEHKEEHCAVWAINKDWCLTKAKRIISKEFPEFDKLGFKKIFFDKILSRKILRFAYPFEENLKNERILKQKGLFLCQGSTVDTLLTNLKSETGDITIIDQDPNNTDMCDFIIKLKIPINIKPDVVEMLKSKGLTEKKLLPGKDMFGRMVQEIQKAEEGAKERREKFFKEKSAEREKRST